jgi:hypothetical protein
VQLYLQIPTEASNVRCGIGYPRDGSLQLGIGQFSVEMVEHIARVEQIGMQSRCILGNRCRSCIGGRLR